MIKAIAVDMDGTFLRSNNTYDKPRFEKIFKQMTQRDIQFIVASGNQYYQLKSFFPGKTDVITFVSENGAIIGKKGNLQSVAAFTPDLVEQILTDLLKSELALEFILCGIKSAYLLETCRPSFKKFAAKYYYELTEVASFESLPEDTFVKIALDVPIEKVHTVVTKLNNAFSGQIVAVASGHGSIDIILPGVTKGSTVAHLLKKSGITPNELMAFGDANNDLELLALTEHSYAMAQSSESIKAIAKHQAPANDESGVWCIDGYRKLFSERVRITSDTESMVILYIDGNIFKEERAMKGYTEKQTVPISAMIAWEALKAMNIWLPKLSTNEVIVYDKKSPFFREGKKYDVHTKEGIVMKSELYKIDSQNQKVEIRAKWFILRSYLTCQVKFIDPSSCELIRTQSYPGIVGKLFTAFFNQRESKETSEYLQVWQEYALTLTKKK